MKTLLIKLIKIADELDRQGFVKLAVVVDELTEKFVRDLDASWNPSGVMQAGKAQQEIEKLRHSKLVVRKRIEDPEYYISFQKGIDKAISLLKQVPKNKNFFRGVVTLLKDSITGDKVEESGYDKALEMVLDKVAQSYFWRAIA